MADFDLDSALDLAASQPDSRRAEILRAAERLFAQRGFDGVRVRDIAAAADVNAATLHLHWKSKAALYEAVCRLHAKQLIEFAKAASSDSGDVGLDRHVDAAVAFLAERPHIASLALQSVADQTPPDIPSLFSHDVSIFRQAEELVRSESESSERGEEPALTVLAVFYFTAVLFCDSPLQRELLGGSVYEDSGTRDRVAQFGKTLVARLLKP